MDYMDSVKIDLCEHWKFHLGEKEEAWYKGFDDSGWEEVALQMCIRDRRFLLPYFSEYISAASGNWYCR